MSRRHRNYSSRHAGTQRGTISLQEAADLDVIHGPRAAQAQTYDAWTRKLQVVDPLFRFTDPPIRRSRLADTSGMARVRLRNSPLTASAALVWSGDLNAWANFAEALHPALPAARRRAQHLYQERAKGLRVG